MTNKFFFLCFSQEKKKRKEFLNARGVDGSEIVLRGRKAACLVPHKSMGGQLAEMLAVGTGDILVLYVLSL